MRGRNKRAVTGLLLGVFLLAGCASPEGVNSLQSDSQVSIEQVARGSNAFALDLYREVAKPGENLFFSPASISLAMGYAYRGTDGQTAEQLRQVMHFPGGPEAYLKGAGALDRTMQISGEGRELRSANAFWVRDDFTLVPGFRADLEREASGAFNSADFGNDPEGARQEINSWVAGQTNDRIGELIPENVLDTLTASVLVNAIYWKADWLYPFPAGDTQEEPFFLADGTEITTDLMNAFEDLRGIKRGSVKLVELPYKGGEVSMVAILPDKPDGLARLESRLSASRLERWLEALDEAEPFNTVLTLPKMSMDWNADLKSVVEGMGAPLAFSKNANFNRLATFPQAQLPDWCGVKITNIIHQANIDVDEKGSEAAAATAAVIGAVVISSGRIGPPPPPPFEFRADHPFMFLLRDNRTGAILFMGRMMDPQQEEGEGPQPSLGSPEGVAPLCPPKL